MKTAKTNPEYEELIKSIGAKIKDLRDIKGISYTKLAKEIGISRNTVNLMELGKTNFQFITLLRILKYHNISFFDFFDSLKR